MTPARLAEENQCHDSSCKLPHGEWVNYGRLANSWECDTQGYATVTRLHADIIEELKNAR